MNSNGTQLYLNKTAKHAQFNIVNKLTEVRKKSDTLIIDIVKEDIGSDNYIQVLNKGKHPESAQYENLFWIIE